MKIIACNWKMNLTLNDSIELSSNIMQFCNMPEIILLPSYVHLTSVSKIISESNLGLGAQNISDYKSGSHTGEISANQISDIGCKYVIIGHSERRLNNFESAEIIKAKIAQALDSNLKIILCIGESAEHFNSGISQEYVLKQITQVIPNSESYKNIILAYEPIWAIGSGLTPEANIIENMADAIRDHSNWQGQILYGGSVNEQNISWLNKIDSIDGFLIGAASTKFDELRSIISTVYKGSKS